MKIGIINTAVEEAKKSEHKHKIGAVIFSGKRIISHGHNYSCRSIKNLHPRFIKYNGSLHAEVNAIVKAKRDISGFDILVIRLNKREDLMLAFPCKYCIAYLIYCGINNIFYSTNEGTIEKFKL
jgi:deoxycytidylate deaminase